MKRTIQLLSISMLVMLFTACNFTAEQHHHADGDHDGHKEAVKPTSSEGNFGDAISADGAITASELPELLEGKETVEIKLVGDVESVCQMTGCWADVSIGDDEIVHVTFKDDGFLLPKDAAGKTAVIEGVASYEEIPVKLLKHLAEDEGKSQEEIDAITQPKMEYTFIAKGVILQDGIY